VSRSRLQQGLIEYILVAVGALAALGATQAAVAASWEHVFIWLGVGAAVEFADGLKVPDDEPSTVSGLAGIMTPDVTVASPNRAVSFLNSVFVPVIALLQAGFLDGWLGFVVAILILWSALYRMSYLSWGHRTRSYVGFPAAWGVVAFYLHAFDATQGAAALIAGIVMIAALLQVPWPHPTRTAYWPLATRALLVIWFLTAGAVLRHGFPASPVEKAILVFCGAYPCLIAARDWMRVPGGRDAA
jgi:phosphatidylcholine synthase